MELFAGFFGIDANGTQPECGATVVVELDEESVELDGDGYPRPCFEVTCQSCGGVIDPTCCDWEVLG